ncbi:universal stress protein [Halopseudomonas pelagia]|uniref:universal stress protein n=1 Tax=Halopseudomonas pelagia TaxID=553151 RepID=UPI0003A63681|nr:universal stress protein [Halopseudomonas pelagia]|tara:strand:+ start:188462 stop:189322 length:861 start_codon:yes stop_codon:yes gene_type:complete
MQSIKRILVVIDPTQTDQLALNRAKLIAGVIESDLHLLVCEDRQDHLPMLDKYCSELKASGIEATSSQAWHGSMTDTVIHVLGSQGCELVVKQHLPDSPLKKALLTPDDWKLLRYCPVPVLLVKTTASWMKGSVLAAVDVGNHDDQHHVLHDTIVSHAADIVEMINGDLHLVSAHPAPMLSAADPIYQVRENIANRYRDEAQRYATANGLDLEHMHIDEGPADTLIPKVARHIGASVTVIGTVARKGIAGALIGNTAEVILDQLDSDILVLKPEDTMAHLESILQR